MNVLVTGGTGFIGGHLVRALLERGEQVKVLSRDPRAIPEWMKEKVAVIKADLGAINRNEVLFDDIDIVYHLAGYVHIDSNPRAKSEVERVRQINVEGTRRLLGALGDTVKHFVFFSSVKVYSDLAPNGCRDEQSQTEPDTVYGQTKLEVEHIVRDWGESRHIKTTSLRLPLVYGPGNKGNIDRMIRAIKRDRFVVFGNGLNKRSMVYVGNIVDAAFAVTNKPEADKKVFIVTDGMDYTLTELCSLVARYFGKSGKVVHVPLLLAHALAKAGDIAGAFCGRKLIFNSDVLSKLSGESVYSSKRIQEEVGFIPKYNFYNTINGTLISYGQSISNG
jgi:nucleoside-diphosphate-sugar epimerase